MEPNRLEEWQLLSFFEVEPERFDAHEDWFVNDLAYVVQRGRVSLRFEIAPYCRDLRISLKSEDGFSYDFKALGVRDVRLVSENHVETLVIDLGDSSSLLLTMRPAISLIHRSCTVI